MQRKSKSNNASKHKKYLQSKLSKFKEPSLNKNGVKEMKKERM